MTGITAAQGITAALLARERGGGGQHLRMNMLDAAIDGSFKAIRENFAEGFRQVQPDGSFKDCPFTLPQYQEGECLDYVVPGFCTDDDICTYENPCLSAVDCPFGHACIDWQCS